MNPSDHTYIGINIILIREITRKSGGSMRLFTLLAMLITCVGVLPAADSLHMSVNDRLDTAPLRGVTSHDGIIYAYAKSPKIYSIQYLCGGGSVILDSLDFSGMTVPAGTNLSGRWISCGGDAAFMANWADGVQAVDISDPLTLRASGTISPAGQIRSVYYDDGTLLACANSSGVHAVGATDPGSMSLISTYDTGGDALDAVMGGTDRVYVAEDGLGFSVWDAGDFATPLGWLELYNTPVCVAPEGDSTMLVATFEGNIRAADVTDADSPEGGVIHSPGSDVIYQIRRESGILGAACGTSGIYIYSRPDGAAEAPDSGYYVPDAANLVDVHIQGRTAFAADAEGALWVFDISDFTGIDERRISIPEVA